MATFGRTQEITHAIGADGAFALSVTSADVSLTAVTGEQVNVRATFEVSAADEATADQAFESLKLRVTADSGSLEVSEADRGSNLPRAISRMLGGLGGELVNVTVEAPAGASLDIRVVSGDVHASGFVGRQKFQSVSGDLRLVDAGGELDIDSVSGDIGLRAVSTVDLETNSVSGDLSAEAPGYRRLRLQSVSGDLSVDGALVAGGSYAMDTVSGDVRLATASGVSVAVRGMSSDVTSSLPHRLEGSADRRRLVVGDGAALVVFNSMSGDVVVTRSRQSAAAPAPEPPTAPTPAAPVSPDQRISILAALEKGEITVDEAMRLLGAAE